MNLKLLKSILNQDLPEEIQENLIINVLSKDENVVPLVMKIINAERNFKKQLTSEMNNLLGKLDCGLTNPKLNKDNFMQKEVEDFYKKYKGIVSNNFKA